MLNLWGLKLYIMDYTTAFILIIVAAAAYILSVFISPSEKSTGELKEAPRGDVEGMSLMKFNGFGNSFSGKFRKALLNGVDTFVTYNCLYILFVPVLPIEAYRVSRAQDGKGYLVYGKEKMKAREAFSIVLRTAATVCAILGIIFLITEITNG